MGTLQDWLAGKPAWVGDALHRAAIAGEATTDDAREIALRVQAGHGILSAGQPACVPFDTVALTSADATTKVPLLGSIGPLDNVDRLLAGQQLKFGLRGLTVVYGENGSGKSGYARAARRLCTARVPIVLQSNVFSTELSAPSVTFTLKTGDADPVSHTWTEGAQLPDACQHISFLDTANAAAYIEDKTEILFLPPEVQVLTILGQLYVLAAQNCQAEVDRLTTEHGTPLGIQFTPTTTAGSLVGLLTTTTTLPRLPTEEQLKAAAQWDSEAAARLAELRLQLAQGPAAQAQALRRLAKTMQEVADSATNPLKALDPSQVEQDATILRRLEQARSAAETFASQRAGEFPIPTTGGETWRELFLLARRFAAEVDVVQDDGAFADGDLCVLCQQPLDSLAANRMNAFDDFITDATADALTAARQKRDDRVQQLRDLTILTAGHISQALSEHQSKEDLRAIVEAAALASQDLIEYRQQLIEYLQGGELNGDLPDTAPLIALAGAAAALVARAEILEVDNGFDAAAQKAVAELADRQTLAGCLALVSARRNGLAERILYTRCVDDLGTGPVSRQATALRSELVSPDLRKWIKKEIAALGIDHIPLKFTEQSSAGKSFFEMALDSANPRKKKQHVLSEGEQRALAIACFLADPHVRGSSGALIVDDPVTSLDHHRVRRVADRFVDEAATGRQVIIFTHNLLFYQELLRACADRDPQVGAVPCLIRQTASNFGLVTVNDQPWIAKKVKERQQALAKHLSEIPDNLPSGSDEIRIIAKQFYTDLRETWERAVEEIVLGGVVERFGADVKTQSLKMVDVADDDYRTIFFAMKRASERSGHDQAQGRQIDPPSKNQMKADLEEFRLFVAAHRKKINDVQERRKGLESAPIAVTI